jgi:hypothetical protein
MRKVLNVDLVIRKSMENLARGACHLSELVRTESRLKGIEE